MSRTSNSSARANTRSLVALPDLIDHRETEKDFDKWRADHMAEVRKWAVDYMSTAVTPFSRTQASMAAIAAHTGLSHATVTRYVKHRDMGKRGPMLYTVLALRGGRL